MTPPRNSNAARDIANVLHPYTDAKAFQQTGPLVITSGKGVKTVSPASSAIAMALDCSRCA